jgi:putative tricarboxylic transport membrane protein
MNSKENMNAKSVPYPLSSQSPQRLTRWNVDTISSLWILLFCLYFFYQTFQFDEVSPMLSQNIPPTFFPRVILTAVLAMSSLLLVRGLRKSKPEQDSVPVIVYLTGGGICAGLLVLHLVGIYTLIFLMGSLLPILWGERRYGRVLIFAVLTPFLIYLLFDLLLGLRLPLGLLESIY